MNFVALQKYLDATWKIYSKSETVDDFFHSLLKSLAEIIEPDILLLYLEDDSVVSGINYSEGSMHPSPVFTNHFVLASTFFRTKGYEPLKKISVQSLKLNKQTKISHSVYFQALSTSVIGLTNERSFQSSKLLTFDSPKITLCRALLIVYIADLQKDDQARVKTLVGQFLDYIAPLIEAVYRRQIDRLSRKIVLSRERLYTGDPGYSFQHSFKEICEALKIEGASLIVKGLPSSRSSLQLVSTYPKELPQDRNTYPENSYSPTQWVFSFNENCIVPSVIELRQKLRDTLGSKFSSYPIWCDSNNITIAKDRCIVYNFYMGQDDINYLFRCTNSKKNSSNLFHILDRKIGQEIVISLALMHKAIENEFRAMRIFVDVKHEFRQKLIGLNSAANYVSKSLVRQSHNEKVMHERLMKLTHIKSTVTDIVKMLNRFNFPLPSLQKDETEIKPFKPYADLVRPICETYIDKARKKGLYFNYHGKDQLGLIYSNIAEWKQVVENIVNNMIKYTFRNEKMAVAFQRNPHGGGVIHFASRSILIREEEKDLIFEFRYRTKMATNQTEDGDGIGLSIAKYIVSGHGGQILVKTKDDINVFSITLPSHLFRVAENL